MNIILHPAGYEAYDVVSIKGFMNKMKAKIGLLVAKFGPDEVTAGQAALITLTDLLERHRGTGDMSGYAIIRKRTSYTPHPSDASTPTLFDGHSFGLTAAALLFHSCFSSGNTFPFKSFGAVANVGYKQLEEAVWVLPKIYPAMRTYCAPNMNDPTKLYAPLVKLISHKLSLQQIRKPGGPTNFMALMMMPARFLHEDSFGSLHREKKLPDWRNETVAAMCVYAMGCMYCNVPPKFGRSICSIAGISDLYKPYTRAYPILKAGLSGTYANSQIGSLPLPRERR